MENSAVKPVERKLPSLTDLVGEEVDVLKNDALNLLLNQEVPAAWLKKHPFIRDHSYITIQRIETLLTVIFQEWKIEVIETKQLFNAVTVTVRLHYRSPLDGTWKYHDGVGAVGVQTDKGEAASNLNAIKPDAVMKALPAAKSYAIKDAAGHLGKLFGRDIDRKDVVEFQPKHMTKWTQDQQ